MHPFCIFFVPELNAQKHSQTCSSVYLGTLDAFVAKKSTRVSLPGNSAFGCRNAPVLHRFSCGTECPKTLPNMFYCIFRKIACVRCEKIHPRLATANSALGTRNAPGLHHFSCW